jgi:hypothetical protein
MSTDFLDLLWFKKELNRKGPTKDEYMTDAKCKINLINYNKDMKSDSKNTL